MFSEYNLDKNEISMIPIEKIKSLYFPCITEIYNKRMKTILDNLSIFDLLLPVEKHPQKDEFILVGRYDTYIFISKNTKLKEIPCLIEGYTGTTNQYLKIFQRLQNRGDTNKRNKQGILNILLWKGVTYEKIEMKTGFTKHDLKNYNYDKIIPGKYINSHTTEKTLNWICNLNLNNDVKVFLYKKAGHPKGDMQRLTEEKRKFLQALFREVKRFYQLSSQEQINVINNALSFKGIMIFLLQAQIDRYINNKV